MWSDLFQFTQQNLTNVINITCEYRLRSFKFNKLAVKFKLDDDSMNPPGEITVWNNNWDQMTISHHEKNFKYEKQFSYQYINFSCHCCLIIFSDSIISSPVPATSPTIRTSTCYFPLVAIINLYLSCIPKI